MIFTIIFKNSSILLFIQTQIIIKLFPGNIKSKNSIQKYLDITELSACILNMFVFYVFISNKPYDFFRNMFNTKTFKVNNFIISLRTKQSNVYQHLHIH